MRKSLILFVLFWSNISFAQQSDWEIYAEIDGVRFETKFIECYSNEILTFRISNSNNYSVYIIWHEEVWVDGVCKQTGESDEDEREIQLFSHEVASGSCEFKESFYIGSKINRGSRVMSLTHFDLKNITVSKKIDCKN